MQVYYTVSRVVQCDSLQGRPLVTWAYVKSKPRRATVSSKQDLHSESKLAWRLFRASLRRIDTKMHDINMDDFSSRLQDPYCSAVYSVQYNDATRQTSDDDLPSRKRQKTSGNQSVAGIQPPVAFGVDTHSPLDFLTAYETVNPAYFSDIPGSLSENILSQGLPFSGCLFDFPSTQKICWDESNQMMVDTLPQSDINPQLVEICTPIPDKEVSIVNSTEENFMNPERPSKTNEPSVNDISMTRFGPRNPHSREFIDRTCFGTVRLPRYRMHFQH